MDYRDDTLSADRYEVPVEPTPEPDTCWVHYITFGDGQDCPDCVVAYDTLVITLGNR